MLPVVGSFGKKHKGVMPIVVADAAMLSEERLTELRAKGVSYIVGARLANANLDLVKQVHAALGNKNETRIRFPSLHDGLVCDFSVKRYKKELRDLNKLIRKAEEIVADQSS